MEKLKVLILGASGRIARHVINLLQKKKDIKLTLFLRDREKLDDLNTIGMRIVEGDVLDLNKLKTSIEGQDFVYANLSGRLDKMAENIVGIMSNNGVKRLVFITSLGIYNEVPGAFGNWNNKMIGSDLNTYRKAAEIIEASDLDYTIVRPAWLTDDDEVNYETTRKGEPFKGTKVSRKSVGSYIAGIIQNPQNDVMTSVGINKPGASKPTFY